MKYTKNGKTVSVTGKNAREAVASKLFENWFDRLSPDIEIMAVEFQSVDLIQKGGKPTILFIKMRVTAHSKDGRKIPGIIVLRGDSVGMLVVVSCGNDKFVLLVKQERLAAGGMPLCEIVAGMIDEGESPHEAAIRELAEETNISARPEELVLLSQSGGISNPCFLSPGLLDEQMHLFALAHEITLDELESMRGRQGGVATENERVEVVLVPFSELSTTTADYKALLAYKLYLEFLNGR